jgi:hypothetical protein
VAERGGAISALDDSWLMGFAHAPGKAAEYTRKTLREAMRASEFEPVCQEESMGGAATPPHRFAG